MSSFNIEHKVRMLAKRVYNLSKDAQALHDCLYAHEEVQYGQAIQEVADHALVAYWGLLDAQRG